MLARTWLEAGLDPVYLRYYLASKQGPTPGDIDLSLDEIEKRVNAELVGRIVNLASRSAKFLKESGLSSAYPADGGLFGRGAAMADSVAEAYEQFDFARVTRMALEIADRANEYVDRMAPWALAKAGKTVEAQGVATVVMNAFRQVAIYLAPIVPSLAEQAETLMRTKITSFADAKAPLVGVRLSEFTHMIERVDGKKLAAMVEASKV